VRVFRAISREQVLGELHAWAVQERLVHPEINRIGLFGSYAKGTFAPGSDIDILILVRESVEPRWFMRAAGFDTLRLSVGADLFVYTEAEAMRMRESSSWFRHILQEIVWIE
jgi:predicted nucleotidyltransferase